MKPDCAVLRTAESVQDVERGLEILHELHQKRRESLGDPGCFASPRFANFLALAATRFQQLGRLRLQWIELDGRPAAAEFDLSSADAVYHYQSGMDPDAAQDKPGWLMQISRLALKPLTRASAHSTFCAVMSRISHGGAPSDARWRKSALSVAVRRRGCGTVSGPPGRVSRPGNARRRSGCDEAK